MIDLNKIKSEATKADIDREYPCRFQLIEFLSKDINFGNKALSDRKKESFYSELAILLSSGIDLRTSLEIIIEEQAKEKDKLLFRVTYNEIIKGKSLSEALSETGRFSLYEYYSLKIGEESGRIREVLSDLTIYFSRKIKQRRQLTSALTYPFMVIFAACLAVFFMLHFIVPMFTEVFKRFQGELPPLTRFIISLSHSFSKYSLVLLSIVAILAIIVWAVRKKSFYKTAISWVILNTPILSPIIKKVYLARYCQSMALLMGSKTPMLQSVQLVGKMIRFHPFVIALKQIEDDILHGQLLHVSRVW